MSRDFKLESNSISLDEKSKSIRILILNALRSGGRGHLGPALSLLEITRVLYEFVLKHDPRKPDWQERDRFILSKGHGCLALFAVLADNGYFKKEELLDFCKFLSPFGGHPESATVRGVEFSTGSLGHGLPVGVGIAMAARLRKEDWRTFILMGDGEINEGSIWEAAMHASQHKLGRLCAIIDYNKMQAWGESVKILDLEPLKAKWEAFGFDVTEVNGHDISELTEVLNRKTSDVGKPQAIIAHTVKGKGISAAENSSIWHHKAKISEEEIDELLADLLRT